MPFITKARISSPLEAGSSLHDSKQLSPQFSSALEYVSSRLARKSLHITLIVVRKDVMTPSISSPARTPSPTHSVTASPARSLFAGSVSPTFSRSISRTSSQSSLSSATSTSASTSRSLSRTQYPSLPSSPRDASALPLASPALSCRSFSSSEASPVSPRSPNPFGISLMHPEALTPKAEKNLRHYVAKAEKRFDIGTNYLTTHTLTTAVTCPSTSDLLRRSLVQNSPVFASNGLTLLELDHVYTFKCHLRTYSMSLTPSDLTLAVDELRRLVLAQHGRRVAKGYLMRAYEWLGVSLAALVDVNEAYKIAYGGLERQGGIEIQNEERKSPPPLKTNFAPMEFSRMNLRMVTDEPSGRTGGRWTGLESGESRKGTSSGLCDEDRGPHRRGPTTPNGWEDITPVTKGEWCFLMVGQGWKEGRRAAVETC